MSVKAPVSAPPTVASDGVLDVPIASTWVTLITLDDRISLAGLSASPFAGVAPFPATIRNDKLWPVLMAVVQSTPVIMNNVVWSKDIASANAVGV